MPEKPDPLTVEGMLNILRNDLEEKKQELKNMEERLRALKVDTAQTRAEAELIQKYINIIEERSK